MPGSASDYTAYVKNRAASLPYLGTGQVPRAIQTVAQPFISKTILNTQIVASQQAAINAPKLAVVSSTAASVKKTTTSKK